MHIIIDSPFYIVHIISGLLFATNIVNSILKIKGWFHARKREKEIRREIEEYNRFFNGN